MFKKIGDFFTNVYNKVTAFTDTPLGKILISVVTMVISNVKLKISNTKLKLKEIFKRK